MDAKQRVKIFEYLDDLRESGETNMYGSPAYVQREFGLDKYAARDVVKQWMDTFSLDKTASERAAEAQA